MRKFQMLLLASSLVIPMAAGAAFASTSPSVSGEEKKDEKKKIANDEKKKDEKKKVVNDGKKKDEKKKVA